MLPASFDRLEVDLSIDAVFTNPRLVKELVAILCASSLL